MVSSFLDEQGVLDWSDVLDCDLDERITELLCLREVPQRLAVMFWAAKRSAKAAPLAPDGNGMAELKPLFDVMGATNAQKSAAEDFMQKVGAFWLQHVVDFGLRERLLTAMSPKPVQLKRGRDFFATCEQCNVARSSVSSASATRNHCHRDRSRSARRYCDCHRCSHQNIVDADYCNACGVHLGTRDSDVYIQGF